MPNIAVSLNQLCPVRSEHQKTALSLFTRSLFPLLVTSLLACGDSAGSSFAGSMPAPTPGAGPVQGVGSASPAPSAGTGTTAAPSPGSTPAGSPATGETTVMPALLAPTTPGTPTTAGTPTAPGTPAATDTPMATDTPATPETPAPAEACPTGPVCHEFFANDNGRNIINYVNEFDPSKNWSKPVGVTGANSPRQVELVDNADVVGGPLSGKAIMVSVNTGFQEYHPVTGERLIDVRLAGTTDVRGAVRLADGNTILGIGNDTLRTVNRAGATVRSCTLPGPAIADSLRVINRDPATGFLMLGRALDLYIVNETCQQQWTAQLPTGSKAYSVLARPGGGVWATSGAPSTVIEFNQQGQILQQIGGKTTHAGLGLDFFSGFEILPNGNMVVANWQGHLANPMNSTPHLVEFNPANNELVWRWGDQTLARQITNTLMLR